MTALAGDVGVCSIEYKSGTEVIKRLLALRQSGYKQRDEQQRQLANESHCSVLTSVNVAGE